MLITTGCIFDEGQPQYNGIQWNSTHPKHTRITDSNISSPDFTKTQLYNCQQFHLPVFTRPQHVWCQLARTYFAKRFKHTANTTPLLENTEEAFRKHNNKLAG